jgi:hypothetical protein
MRGEYSMEMRKDNANVDYFKEFKQGGQTMDKEFDKLKEFILETNHGVILVDDKLKEKRFKKIDIDNLFYLINEHNIKEIKYIPHEMNMFLIAEIAVTTINNEYFLIKLEKHYKLY